MAADSAAAGYLRPSAGPAYGEALEDVFGRAIAGATGLPPSLVRPKYQPDPPNVPQFDVDWCAFRVYVLAAQWNASRTLEDDGTMAVEGVETLEVLASFWGPNYQETERRWRDGLQVPQNRDGLTAAGIALVQFAEPVVVPLLLKQQWTKHADVRGTFTRWARRTYPVRTLLSADGNILGDRTPEGEVLSSLDTDQQP